jgi:4-methylaminobutanoate oxidase (formaldehyde-forming)
MGVVSIMGPAARTILSRVTTTRLGNAEFPFGHSAEILIAGQTVRAMRVTYVGELGWELHGAASALPPLWDAILHAGAPEGIRPAGTYAINTMRIEKAYRAFGTELSSDENPFQAGLGFAISWGKEFLGKAKLLALKEQPLSKRLVSLAVKTTDPAVTLWGNEPIFRDGVLVGYTSSGCFSPTLGQPLALGYIKRPGGGPVDVAYLTTGDYTILHDGVQWPATICRQSPVDPNRRKILA